MAPPSRKKENLLGTLPEDAGKSARTRMAILESAIRLFKVRGYSLTTTRDITAEAGVSKGLLYNYFNSKDEILKAVIALRGARVAEKLREISLNGSPAEKLISLARAYFSMISSDPDYFRFRMALVLQPDVPSALKKYIRQTTEKLFPPIAELFRAQGPAAARVQAHRFMALLDGIIFHKLSVFPSLSLDEMGKSVEDFILISFKKPFRNETE